MLTEDEDMAAEHLGCGGSIVMRREKMGITTVAYAVCATCGKSTYKGDLTWGRIERKDS